VDTRVHWYFERMIRQTKYMAFQVGPFFPDGRAMRTPPGGTVPRGMVIETAMLTQGIAAGPEVELRPGGVSADFPFPLTDEIMRLGRKQFDITCAACHGVAGDAASAVAAKMQLRPPPSLHQPALRAYTPGQLFRVVTEGYGLMPSYVTVLNWEERWAVVAYVKALQLSQSATVGALPELVRGELLEQLEGGAR
jgi:mono/diheme cytochrome c family protein